MHCLSSPKRNNSAQLGLITGKWELVCLLQMAEEYPVLPARTQSFHLLKTGLQDRLCRANVHIHTSESAVLPLLSSTSVSLEQNIMAVFPLSFWCHSWHVQSTSEPELDLVLPKSGTQTWLGVSTVHFCLILLLLLLIFPRFCLEKLPVFMQSPMQVTLAIKGDNHSCTCQDAALFSVNRNLYQP